MRLSEEAIINEVCARLDISMPDNEVMFKLLLDFLKEQGYVRLAEDQSFTGNPYSPLLDDTEDTINAYSEAQQDMLNANFRKVKEITDERD